MWGALEIILAVAVCLALVVVTAACVCGCQKETPKSELVGTAGVVKLHFEEEILPAQTTPLSGKRVPSQNSHRSLPEIPPSVPRQDSGDTASDLYATVGTNQRVSERSSPSVIRQSDHPYEHAYAKLQSGHRAEEQAVENEALVGNSSGTLPLLSGINEEAPSANADSSVPLTASVAISGQVSSSQDLPYMTPPVASIAAVSTTTEEIAPRISNQHFSGDSVDSAKGYTSISVREPLSSIRTNIPAARITQPNYANGSDDSDDMYAAIDEPLNQVYTSGSETYAQIQLPNAQRNPPSIITTSTVESTSNTRPQNSSASNSTVATSINPQLNDSIDSTSSKRSSVETTSSQTVQKHTRQASNSSYTETVGILSSPKPEKRQANSPLPPPPPTTTSTDVTIQHKKVHSSPLHHTKHTKHKISSTGNLHEHDKLRRSLNEKHQRNNSCVSSSDFYGCNYPVDKHRFSSGDLGRPLVARELNFSFDKPAEPKPSDAIYNTIDGPNDIYAAIDQEPARKSLTLSQPNVTGASPIKNLDEMYAKVIKKTKHASSDHRLPPSAKLSNYDDSTKSSEQNANTSTAIQLRKKSVQNEEDRLSWSNETKRYSGISSTNGQDAKNNANMKVLNVQTLNKDDPGYETIDRIRNKIHGYETVEKVATVHKSDKSSDPGYETVRDSNRTSDKKHKIIPTVSGGLTQHSSEKKSDGRSSPINEPGYETVPSGPESLLSNDPGYEHIRRERYVSDSDPNYEVLRSRNSTPPYASIRNKSQNAPGYSVVNKKPKVPDQNWLSNNNDNFSSEPNYESMPHDNIYNNSSESDPNYESVGPKDPNYESVKYFDGAIKDPPYEKVKHDSTSSADNPSHFHRNNSASSYEKAKAVLKHERLSDDKNDNKTNGSSLSYVAENAPVADYFQV